MSVGNSVHYLYDTLRPGMGPTAAFTGHVTSSFFIKACFSPDGSHILSGSSDKNAYIWQVGCTPLPGPPSPLPAPSLPPLTSLLTSAFFPSTSPPSPTHPPSLLLS